MNKYQLSDEIYGLFGDTYETEAEAQDALESVIAEYFEDTAEGMEIREAQDAVENHRQPREITDAEVFAEIRQSLFINVVEVADPELDDAARRLTTHPY